MQWRQRKIRDIRFAGLVAAALALSAILGCATAEAPEVPDADRSSMEPQVAQKIQHFRESVFQSPDSHEAWGDLGVVFHAHGLEQEAALCYQKAIELAPSDFRWRYLLVHALFAFDRDAAMEASARALEVSADYPALLMVRAESLEERGAVEDAVALYKRALELDPKSVRAELALGRLAMANGDFDTARSRLERASELAPNAGAVYASLARLYRRVGENDKAAEAARQVASATDPVPITDPIHFRMTEESVASTAQLQHARDLLASGDIARAESIYRDLVALRPDDAAMKVHLGDVLWRQDQRSEAKSLYQAALAIKEDDAGAHAGLAAALSREGAYDDAVDHYRKSLAARSGHVPTIVSLASTLAFQGSTTEAETLYDRALELEPDNVFAQRSFAEFLFRLNRYAEAAQHYRKVLELDPDLGVVHLQLGASLAVTGNYVEARSHLEQARELGQTVPDAVLRKVAQGLGHSSQ
ncbi:MAG: hypothetical protein BMS9Abin37_0608 [Acidobacteriota bacterium]|nr:MAG: hypothetical protein BMS9Abin37_0608 [Acidobacteriota bacterium]